MTSLSLPIIAIVDKTLPHVQGPLVAQGMSKLEIPRFSGVTLPLPKGCEANTERSDESSFPLSGRGARFDRSRQSVESHE
jgi:hypothetical protein